MASQLIVLLNQCSFFDLCKDEKEVSDALAPHTERKGKIIGPGGLSVAVRNMIESWNPAVSAYLSFKYEIKSLVDNDRFRWPFDLGHGWKRLGESL